jgi:hypothetical protein
MMKVGVLSLFKGTSEFIPEGTEINHRKSVLSVAT